MPNKIYFFFCGRDESKILSQQRHYIRLKSTLGKSQSKSNAMGSSGSKQLKDEEEEEGVVFDTTMISWDQFGNLRFGKGKSTQS